jgi:hypothetical protein
VTIRTCAGEITLEAPYGQEPENGRWLAPVRELWNMTIHQIMSPALEEKICYTATRAGSFEAAAELAAKWGSPVDDAVLHHHVQQAGERAETLAQARTERALDVQTRAEVVAEAKRELPGQPFDLVLMLDGWMIRERGEQWGLKPPGISAERVAWREMKSGIVFRLDQRAQSESGRRMIVEKFYVSHRGGPEELGRRLYAEALRRGLNQARRVYVIADGAIWIWNVVQDRFPEAIGGLDFHHASQNLWAVAHELFGEGTPEARAWVEPLLHQLGHGGEAGVLETLEDLMGLCQELDAQAKAAIEAKVAYFEAHREHLHYQQLEEQGCPKGSGAMESTCSQFQDRFKRTGQYWTLPGETHLMALELARRNQDWDKIWSLN